MSASAQCHHPDFTMDMRSMHFPSTNIHFLQVRLTCKTCAAPMKFIAEPVGPTTSPDMLEISFPFIGHDEEPIPLMDPQQQH